MKQELSGAKGVVLGVSGGIDSAVCLRLCARAVGKGKVLGLLMPEKESPKDDLRDSKDLCREEGVRFEIIDISKIIKAVKDSVHGRVNKKSLANIKARCRMVVMYHYANTESRLVIGTSNKSEILIGYFTKFGDEGRISNRLGTYTRRRSASLRGRLAYQTESSGRFRQPASGRGRPTRGKWESSTRLCIRSFLALSWDLTRSKSRREPRRL